MRGPVPLDRIADEETLEAIRQLRNTGRPGSFLCDVADLVEGLVRGNYDLLRLSAGLESHPEFYEGPCLCRRCREEGAVDLGEEGED